MQCLRGLSIQLWKAGFVHGRQRYKCKFCSYHFTKNALKGKPKEIKRLALHMDLEGLGFRSIGRVLGVSNVAVS